MAILVHEPVASFLRSWGAPIILFVLVLAMGFVGVRWMGSQQVASVVCRLGSSALASASSASRKGSGSGAYTGRMRLLELNERYVNTSSSMPGGGGNSTWGGTP